MASITYHIAFGLLEHLLWVAPNTHHIAFITFELIFPLIYHFDVVVIVVRRVIYEHQKRFIFQTPMFDVYCAW